MFLYPYNMNSEGSISLAKALKVKRIRTENSTFVGDPKKVVINWGASLLPPEVMKCRVINRPEATSEATDKLRFFQKVRDVVDIPQFTVDPDEAKKWYDEGVIVFGRAKLRASGGDGIFVMDKSEEENYPFRKAGFPLYVKYIPKKDEYRVHFVNGQIIDFQRKALRSDANPEETNWKVRNLANGFVFIRSDVELPPSVKEQAEKVIAALSLDFGAIDIIYNEKRQRSYVLEVNTAPGLMGTTLENYATAFEAYRG